MKKRRKIPYNYIVKDISDGKGEAFEAYLPTIKTVVFGDNMDELLDGIEFSIEAMIDDCKEEGRVVPLPDVKKKFSGKFIFRLGPGLHEKLALESQITGKSINSIAKEKINTSYSV